MAEERPGAVPGYHNVLEAARGLLAAAGAALASLWRRARDWWERYRTLGG